MTRKSLYGLLMRTARLLDEVSRVQALPPKLAERVAVTAKEQRDAATKGIRA